MDAWSVSVVIPTLPERGGLLANAIRSVNAQTLTPYEVIVEEVQEGDDAGVTRNRGLARVKTPWVAFLDDDDELEPNHLQVLVDAVKEEQTDVAYSWFKILKGDGSLEIADDVLWLVDTDNRQKSGFGVAWNPYMVQALRHNNFVHICCLIRTEKAREAGGFPVTGTPEWPELHSEDWGFWIRMLKCGATFQHIPKRTWHWRHWDGRTNGQPYRRNVDLVR